MSLSGGLPRTVGQAGGGPIGVAARGNTAYYLRLLTPDGELQWLLVEVDLVTGAERTFSDFRSGLALVMDGEDVIGSGCSGSGSIERISPVSSAVTRLDTYSFCPLTLANDGSDIYFSDSHPRPDSRRGVFRLPLEGGTPERLAYVTGFAFAVHRGFVYAQQEGALVRVSTEGGPALRLASVSNEARIWGIAVDDDFVYWTVFGDEITLHQAPHPR